MSRPHILRLRNSLSAVSGNRVFRPTTDGKVLSRVLRAVCLSTLGIRSILTCCYAMDPDNATLSYDREIRPILAEYCFACHGFDSSARQGDLRLDTREGALHSGSGGAINPGNPETSWLMLRIESTEHDVQMPPPETGKRLTEQQKELLRQWITQGAEYQQHWSFTPPVRSSPPAPERQSLTANNEIDLFIQFQLRQVDLEPAVIAMPETLLRRLCFDLIGLPPSPEQLDQFLSLWKVDPDQAYSQSVDWLLASPHFGERLGRWWLDQARYADSNGYSIDRPRQIWAYRDWVVQALNADIPFDQFTIHQLAGDLLPNAGTQQLIATGFHRNTQLNEEGGIDKEQFRIESVFDRVATTGTVWLGLTISCAQCHDHKFDPITQTEYYRLFAFLNNQDEPSLEISLSDQKKATTLVMRELDEPRKTHLLIQGDFTRPSVEIQPGTPQCLPGLQVAGLDSGESNDANDSEGSASKLRPNRLDLARWLVDRNNPLTARVVVNRLWQHLFGRGLVATDNDFGLQGSPPSHPELLDWLAVELMESGWQFKHILRLMVSSHVYRQSSLHREDVAAVDPNNLLLAKQSRLRLDAEVVRDVALAASGMLASQLSGPPVYPPIPEGVLSLGQAKQSWKTSQGGDRYRRGLYTFIYRATPPPAMNVFDAPDGLSTCTRRPRSNTPLQALTLMNDTAFFELAQGLSQIIQQQGLPYAFRRCTSRLPSESEIATLQRLDSLSAARVLLNLDETITRE